MDHQDLRTLKLLEEIDTDDSPSQRDLAQRLNISLGLVNSFIKRLVQKGYCKVTSIPKNRVRYLLTPKGAAEKTRLTYEYIQYSLKFYKGARQKLRSLCAELMAQDVKRVLFFGATDLAEIAYLSLKETSIQLVGIIDETKAGEHFIGFQIAPPAGLSELDYDKVLLTAIKGQAEIRKRIESIGVPSSKILSVR